MSEPIDPTSGAADEWLSAPEAYRQIVAATWAPGTNLAIAQRAHAGLLRAKAQMFIADDRHQPDAQIPTLFWWAGGHEAMVQDWKRGDFETWHERSVFMRALGVSFNLGDLRNCFPDIFKADSVPAAPAEVAVKGGRPPAEWWDDLWIEMCRALYAGDLKPLRQADVEKAMNEWIASNGESAAVSTVRSRARKLWQAISRKDEN